jgi:hypothetical protein
VAYGNGLFDLCKAAEVFRKEFDIDITVFGFDNAAGPPRGAGCEDHPEIWQTGQFKMPDPAAVRSGLPDFAKLMIGDLDQTPGDFESEIFGARLGFCAVDLDLYSSTRDAMKLFEMNPLFYVPAVPMYVDDVEVLISYNPWCGEAAAINEFNQSHELRKIHMRPNFHIHNFHVCHILDHPMRTGQSIPRFPFEIMPF